LYLEIAENLHRAELTALERDEQVAKWIELNQQRIDASQNATHRNTARVTQVATPVL